MTETVLNALTPTPLAAALALQAELKLELTGYRGVLTPQHLDAAGAETDALLHGAAVHDLGWLRRVAVRGEDRSRWLSGMVTNAVETLPKQSGAYNLVLNAQGRIQGDAIVWHQGGSEGGVYELEIDAAQSEALLAHLDQFIIMDDVELLPLPGWTALGLAGPKAPELLAALGLPAPEADLTSANGTLDGSTIRVQRGYSPLVPRFALWIEETQAADRWQRLIAAGATPVGSNALETLRILEGTPAYGIDIQSRDLAQETSQMRALSFTKGCYLGQEIVERIRSRGQVHRHLRSLEIIPDILPDNASSDKAGNDLPAAGTELQLAGKPAGTLTSVAALTSIPALQRDGTQPSGARRIFAIGMVRAEAEISKEPLRYAGGEARILKTPLEVRGGNAAEKNV
jgi:folate-binding protein YgfZ